MKIKKKGFTLVEILAVIVIIGILSTIAIVAYTKHIDKAKKEIDKQNETTIVMAAKAYMEANPSEKPQSIGESAKVDLKTLKNKNYLKEDIINSKKESCMNNSYVYVYKNDYDKYSYKGVLYCGNDPIEPEKEIPKPEVRDFTFSDAENVKKASFSMVLHGSSDDTIGIESYNYMISVYRNAEADPAEVYNSGSQPVKGKKVIVINNNIISDYIKVTDYSRVKVTVIVRNTLGGVSEFTSTTEYNDTIPPICGSVIDEPGENDWYNKKDILSDQKKRQLIVECSDGNGSGCVRSTFAKTWPGKEKKSVEYSNITIRDNKGKENKCKVRVNVDVFAPTIKVTAYNDKNEEVASTTAVDGKTEEIAKNSYKENYKGWLNRKNYSKGVRFRVELSDDIRLNNYIWSTGESDSDSGYILDESNNQTNSKSFDIYLKVEGKRQGILTVYDVAGNSTSIVINADIDYTNPTCTNDVSCTDGGDCSRWLGIGKSLTIKTICEDIGGSNCADNTGGTFTYDKNINTNSGGPGGKGKSVDVYDNAGNKGTCPANVTVKVDHTSPTCTNEVTCTAGEKCNDWLGIGKYVKIKAKCTDAGGSNCAEAAEISYTYKDENINITNAGPAGPGKSAIVYDNAGNATECPANKTVKIDIEPPTDPKINLYKWNNNNNRPTSSTSLTNKYTAGTWSKMKVFTYASDSTDNYEFDHYEYKTTGKTINTTNYKSSTRNIEADGESTIYYRACDKAKNCSNYITDSGQNSAVVKVDTLPPLVSCKMTNKKISNVSVNDAMKNSTGEQVKCTDNESCSGAKSTKYYAVTTSSTNPSASSSDWKTSIPAEQNACDKTYYGYVKGEDNAGNIAIKNCGSYNGPECCSESNPTGCKWATACRQGTTTLYINFTTPPPAYSWPWAGEARHNIELDSNGKPVLDKNGNAIPTGVNDILYLIKDSNGEYITEEHDNATWMYVYIPKYNSYYGSNGDPTYKKVWIAKNCIGPVNKVCPYKDCPG